MEFTKLSAPSLKDLFVQQLQGMILSGQLPVGAQLPPERVLAEQMQVSRTVVNSGLSELSEQGFLEIRPRQGTCVADYRRRGNLSTLIAIMQYKGGVLGRDEIRSILEVRRALERLGKALAQLAAAPSAGEAAEAAFSFQHELALVSGNSIVPLIYSSFKPPVIALWIRFCNLYGIPALVHNTQTLYTLVQNRDADGASRWIETYLEQAISGIQQIY